MKATPESMRHWLRLGAAIYAYDLAMRKHVLATMRKRYGNDATRQIVACLSDDDQHDYYHVRGAARGNDVPLGAFLEIKHFGRIVDRHSELFGFTDRQRSRIRNRVRQIRNTFAHFGDRRFDAKWVDGRIRLLNALTRKLAPPVEEGARAWNDRMAVDGPTGAVAAEPILDSDRLLRDLQSALRKSERDLTPASAEPDTSVLAERVASALTPQFDALESVLSSGQRLLKEAREDRGRAREELQDLRVTVAELSEDLSTLARTQETSHSLLQEARRAREDADRLRRGEESRSGKSGAPPAPPVQPTPTSSGADRPAGDVRVSAEEIQRYRDQFTEARSGNGWTRTTRESGWRVTHWVGKSRESDRAVVFAPSRRDESGWVTAGSNTLVDFSAGDEDDAFRQLCEAERRGDVLRLAKEAIAAHETASSSSGADDEDAVPF